MPQLDITEVILADCNAVNNQYQNDYRILGTFVPNKLFGQLLNLSPKNQKKFALKNFIQSFHTLKYDLRINVLL